jgi:SAM-dependent methyltransferase
MDIATLWQLCLHFEYDRAALVAGLEEWLKWNKDTKILDCACGTGFPSIDLLQKGYNVTCTDGSQRMLAEFNVNAEKAGVVANPQCIQWSDLSKHFDQEFDVVMCRGSSLIYAGAWDRDATPDREAIKVAIRNFGECLKLGGVLYVDTTSEENLSRSLPEHNTYPERVIGGQRVSLSEVIYTDKNANLRTWESTLTVDGVAYEFERHSYYLPHSDLLAILLECGFGNIRKSKVRGEHYDVFTSQISVSAEAEEKVENLKSTHFLKGGHHASPQAPSENSFRADERHDSPGVR